MKVNISISVELENVVKIKSLVDEEKYKNISEYFERNTNFE